MTNPVPLSTGSIVLIGPSGVGKSTVGSRLAELLEWPLVKLDEFRAEWYPEFGLDPEAEIKAREKGGLLELIATWNPYELLSIERAMREYPASTVIVFGSNQAVYVDEAMIVRAKAALAAACRVILLLPSDSREESMRILSERLRSDAFVQSQPNPDQFVHAYAEVLKMQLQSESTSRLATELVITGRSTPDELAKHIIATMDVD